MFKNLFSFDGRIRRTEYGLSFIMYAIAAVFVNAIIIPGYNSNGAAVFGLAYIPLLWFLWSQGAKRCHDLGNSGWFQIIPLYVFWMIFQEGKFGINEYGANPKVDPNLSNYNFNAAPVNDPNSTTNGYIPSYNGGHNNPNQNLTGNGSQDIKADNGYSSGDLYK